MRVVRELEASHLVDIFTERTFAIYSSSCGLADLALSHVFNCRIGAHHRAIFVFTQ